MEQQPPPQKYYYKDFETGRLRWTRGQFVDWYGPHGPLSVYYAIFARRSGKLWVPEYCVPPATRAKLPPLPEKEGKR